MIAAGTPPLRYQWSVNGTNLNGATSASLTLFNVQSSQAGSYAVMVTNAAGSNLSSSATLIVNPALSCIAPSAPLVSWWRGELNGIDAAGANNGTLAGNATFGTGNVGQGLMLDGNGDGLQIGNPASLQLQNFSLEGWIARADASQVTGNASQEGLIFSYGGSGYGMGLDQSGLPLLTKVGVATVKGTIAVTDTSFHHIAVT